VDKRKISITTFEGSEAIGIKSRKTYTKAFNDLVLWGFIKVIVSSKNQFSCSVISLMPAQNLNMQNDGLVSDTMTSLDKAIIWQDSKQENTESKIPDFVLNEQKQITPYISQGLPLEEVEASMRNSQMLLEAGIRKNQITESEYYKYLEDFFLETRATDKKVKSESDHKKHFLAWLRIQIQNKPKGNISGKMKTGFDEMSRALNRLENDETYERDY
jgi:hypothetical protein